MDFQSGDIILYEPNKLLSQYMLILENLTPGSNFGIVYRVVNLNTGLQAKFTYYPVDKMYITVVAP